MWNIFFSFLYFNSFQNKGDESFLHVALLQPQKQEKKGWKVNIPFIRDIFSHRALSVVKKFEGKEESMIKHLLELKDAQGRDAKAVAQTIEDVTDRKEILYMIDERIAMQAIQLQPSEVAAPSPSEVIYYFSFFFLNKYFKMFL